MPQAMELIRSLIERIEVFPGQKRGNPEVTVHRARWRQILTFGQTQDHYRRLSGRCR